ncbi:MAG: DUF1292 domain-containing protein [Oscillospiraceae bacterium]|jgi:uncharacterized protein YrzB (UPF0473 family)|nr:DUF1292 domain-containing protein [Oscillospiraceae bacterium]
MGDDYGSDFITLTDEDGNSFELEHLDTVEMDGKLYLAFLPADMDENDEDYGMVILRAGEEDGEEMLLTVDDDKELETVYDKFMEQLFGDAPEDFEDFDSPGEPE